MFTLCVGSSRVTHTDWGFPVGNWLRRLLGPFVFWDHGKHFRLHPSILPFLPSRLSEQRSRGSPDAVSGKLSGQENFCPLREFFPPRTKCPANCPARNSGLRHEFCIRLMCSPLTDARGLIILGEEPQAYRDLRAVKKLAGQGDHAIHQVGFDQGFADVAFAGLVGAHAAVGQHKARHALR